MLSIFLYAYLPFIYLNHVFLSYMSFGHDVLYKTLKGTFSLKTLTQKEWVLYIDCADGISIYGCQWYYFFLKYNWHIILHSTSMIALTSFFTKSFWMILVNRSLMWQADHGLFVRNGHSRNQGIYDKLRQSI